MGRFAGLRDPFERGSLNFGTLGMVFQSAPVKGGTRETIPHMSNIEFVAGEFLSLVVDRSFHLGRIQRDVPKGTVLQYDGFTMKWGTDNIPYPELRGCIKVGLLVPQGEAGATPVVAAPAVTPDPKPNRRIVAQEEMQVSMIRGVKEATPEKKFDRTLVREDEGDHRVVSSALSIKGRNVESDIGGAETGEVVGRVVSPSVQKIDLGSGGSDNDGAPVVGSVARRASISDDTKTVGKVASSSTHSRLVVSETTDVASKLREVERQRVKPNVSVVATGKKPGDIHAVAADNAQDLIDATDPLVIARRNAEARKAAFVESQKKLGVTEVAVTTTHPALATPEEVAPPAPVVKPPVVKVATPTTVEEVVLRGDQVTIAPGVTWDKTLHWRTRAKIAVERYRNDPATMALVKAYEEPSVVKLIDEHLARLAAKA